MSDTTVPEASAPQAPPQLDPAAATKKREEAEGVLKELLRLMEIPGRIELKDAADGGIAVALHVSDATGGGELPGVAAGKRSNVIDALQFLANKIVNKPNAEKRWISIGVGTFPEPRQPKPPRQQQQQQQQHAAAPGAPAPGGAPVPPPQPARGQQGPGSGQPGQQPGRGPKPPRQGTPAQGTAPAAAAPRVSSEPEELKLEVAEDVALTAVVKALAEKSAKLGRYFAIAPMKTDDRARTMKAAAGTPGMSVKLEGDGRARRIVFVPEKPVPMPSRSALPADVDEDDEA